MYCFLSIPSNLSLKRQVRNMHNKRNTKYTATWNC